MKRMYGMFAVLMSVTAVPLFAMAQRPQDPGSPPPPAWVQLVPFAVMIGVFYMLLIRPQMKQRKEKDKLVSNLKKGDRVVTQGGFIATVVNVTATTVDVKLNEETKAKVLKSAVVEIYSDTTEVPKETAGTAS